MAVKKNNKHPYNTLREIKEADTFGTRYKLLRDGKKEIDDIDIRLEKVLKSSIPDTVVTNNNLAHILEIARTTITSDIRGNGKRFKKPVTDSNIRSIFEMNEQEAEMELVNIFGEKITNVFVQMHEYRMVTQLIPELGEVLESVTRDILDTDEVTKRAIKDVFGGDVEIEEVNESKIKEEIINDMNKAVEEEVIDRNDLELKIRKWIKDALTIGGKPILITSYKDMLKQVFLEAQNNGNSLESYEDYTLFVEDLLAEENLRAPKLRDKAVKFALHHYSQEDYSLDFDNNNISKEAQGFLTKQIESYYDKIIGSYADKYTRLDLEDLNSVYRNQLLSLEDGDDEKRKEIEENLKNLQNQDKITEINDKNKNMIRKIVDVLDQKIEVVEPTKSALAQAKSTLQSKISFMKYKDTFSDGLFDDASKFLNVKYDYNKPYSEPTNPAPKKDEDNRIGALLFDKSNSTDKTTLSNKLKSILEETDDVLINEYEADRVIPVYVNGSPLWYYIIEEDKFDGWNYTASKRTFSFSEIFASIGFNNDDAVTYGSSLPAAMGGSLGGPIGSGTMMLQNITGAMLTGNDGGEALKKNELLKELILRTIATRLDDPSVADNKAFKDSIINLIKDGFIIDKKVKITCVPASAMVYFGHNIDNDGKPTAFFNNTLLYCYLYLASMISSGIIKGSRASHRDKVKVNIGLSKRIGATIQRLEHEFGTKTVWNAKSFQNISTILTQLGSSQTVYEPVFQDGAVFEYEPIEEKNNYEVDDAYTEKLIEKILSTKVPNSMFNKFNEDDFAKSLVAQNKTYRNRIIDYQRFYSRQINKLLYLVCKNTRFKDDKINEYIKDNIGKIDFVLNPPMRLNLTNSNDIFGEIDVYVENIIKSLFGESAGDDKNKHIVSELRKYLIKKYLPVDMDEIDKMISQLAVDASRKEIEDMIDETYREKVREKIGNSITLNDDDSMDSNDSMADDMGGGGDDDFGSASDDEEGSEDGGEDDFNLDL